MDPSRLRHLNKGVRKFRRSHRQPVNRILYGLMMVSGITVSDLAEKTGIATRTIQAWIFDGAYPTETNRKKVVEIFRLPEDILFLESLKN